MNIVWGFLPFLSAVIVERMAGATVGCTAGAIAAAAVLARSFFGERQSVKLLEVGTLALFAGLAAVALITGARWTVAELRLCIDTGALLIVLLSLIAGKPFTLQYAREQVPPALWNDPNFLRTNYIVSAVWAGTFAVCIVADLLLIFLPSVPPSLSVCATILAIYLGARFTAWYPERHAAQPSRGK